MKWRSNAFEQVCQSKDRLSKIQTEISTLRIQKNELDEKFGMLSKEIFQTEQRWNFLLKLQVFISLIVRVYYRYTVILYTYRTTTILYKILNGVKRTIGFIVKTISCKHH